MNNGQFLNKKVIYGALLFGILGLLSLGIFRSVRADEKGTASLSFGPAQGTFAVGSTFNISLYLDTGGQLINAVEAYISFPSDKLQVVSPTAAAKSFIDIWASEPKYSKREGTISFQGGGHNPGINTSQGVVSAITFRVKSSGSATVKILDTSHVFLADGQATDILTRRQDGLYFLALPAPEGPAVASPTHPNNDKWYPSDTVSFRWEALPDTDGVSYMLDENPVAEPDNVSEGKKVAVSYEKVPDGAHYFHIKRMRNGAWGGVTHFAVKIDHSPPAAFDIQVSPGIKSTNKNPLFSFATTDEKSGINHYELKIISLGSSRGAADTKSVERSETPFFIEVQSPYSEQLNFGNYEIVARAFDYAGNFQEAIKKVAIVRPFMEVIGDKGLVFAGVYTIAWTYVSIALVILFGFLLYSLKIVWGWHRKIEKQFEAGDMLQHHPDEAMLQIKKQEEETQYPA